MILIICLRPEQAREKSFRTTELYRGVFSHTIGGINPRTAFGIDYSKKKVYLAVVDARSVEFKTA